MAFDRAFDWWLLMKKLRSRVWLKIQSPKAEIITDSVVTVYEDNNVYEDNKEPFPI